MSVDLSEFYPKREQRCIVARAILALPLEADREKAEAALATGDISGSSISKWFADHDLRVSVSGVSLHRGRRCSCRG